MKLSVCDLIKYKFKGKKLNSILGLYYAYDGELIDDPCVIKIDIDGVVLYLWKNPEKYSITISNSMIDYADYMDFKYARLSDSEEFVISDLGYDFFKCNNKKLILNFKLIIADSKLVGVLLDFDNGEVMHILCFDAFFRIDDSLDYYIEIFNKEDADVQLIVCS